jgi:hypothetical protein
MKSGHADAQYMFSKLGESLGYKTRRIWSRSLPTDGIWLLPTDGYLLPEAPAVALEVAVSEGPKAIKGSIDTLAEVSPALGVLLINDMEIRRGGLRKGLEPIVIESQIEAKFTAARERLVRHQQRIELWSYEQMLRRYQIATGASGPPTLARLAS